MFARTPALSLRGLYDRSGLATRLVSSSRTLAAQPPRQIVKVSPNSEQEAVDGVRRDLSSLLKEEINEKTQPSAMEEQSDEFFRELKAETDESEVDVRISWSVAPFSVTVSYEKPTNPIDVDGEGLGTDELFELSEAQMQQLAELEEAERQKQVGSGKKGAGEQGRIGRGGAVAAQAEEAVAVDEGDDNDDEEDDGDREDEDDEEDDEEDSDSSSDSEDENEVAFEVQVSRAGKEKPVSFWCVAALDSRLYVEQVFLTEDAPLNFGSLSEEVQDRVYDFLDAIKVDDRFAFSMRRRFFKTKRVASRETLEALVDLVALDEPQSKPKSEPKKKPNKKGN